MSAGGSYSIKDSTESLEFPAPVTDWPEQQLGIGLNGIPALNAYRIHTWSFTGLPEELQAKLVAFQTRQQVGNAAPTSVETDPYDAADNSERYRTTRYTDAVIRSVTRERNYGSYQSTTVTFEIFVA